MEFIENFWFSILAGIVVVVIDYKKGKFIDLKFMLFATYAALMTFSIILWLICLNLSMPFIETALTPVEGIGGKLVYIIWVAVTMAILYSLIYLFKKVNNNAI